MKVALFLVLCCAVAHAQPALQPQVFTRASCGKVDATAALAPADGPAPVPVTWSDFELEGELAEPMETARALFAPVLTRRTSFTDEARADLEATAFKYGYHVVGVHARETEAGTHAVIHVARLPMVKKVKVDVDSQLDDQIGRRLRVRAGTYLPWSPRDRACELFDEEDRVKEYLRDEGYFDAQPTIEQDIDGTAISLQVGGALGRAYKIGRITVADPQTLAIDPATIAKQFEHRRCIVHEPLCWGTARFTRSQFAEDVQDVAKLFQQRGFPAVRVRTDFDPVTSFVRRTKTVPVTISIDPRRKLDVAFEGQSDAVSSESLHKQLTFDKAGSSDDVEAASSARAITAYLQGRGYFDARVTWTRERFSDASPNGGFDRVVFRIDQGRSRQVESVAFAGNRALSTSVLQEVIGTTPERFSSTLFGANTAATSAQLAADVDRIVDAYRRSGYREARVQVDAATDAAALGSAALTAALAAADKGSGLAVRYTIHEGPPTLLAEVRVDVGEHGDAAVTGDERALCDIALARLAELFDDKRLGKPSVPGRCIASAPDVKFREDDAGLTKDALKNQLYAKGRPRAEVAYEVLTIGDHRVAAHYTLAHVQALTIGRVVVRGNFRTKAWVILNVLRDQARFSPGRPLAQEALADGARYLRNTGLFDAVNIELPDLDTTASGAVNAVVTVTERYTGHGEMNIEVGYSSYSGAFTRLLPQFKNLLGLGESLNLTAGVGFDLGDLLGQGDFTLKQLTLEATLRFPRWLSGRWLHLPPAIQFETELSAFDVKQDTPRFGIVTTEGVTAAISRQWTRSHAGLRPARTLTLGFQYDFRLRSRNVDVLRPLGADDDQSQVPISTRIGSVGASFEWEQRTDRDGAPSPLAAERGFRFEVHGKFATQALGGQDKFLELSATGSYYHLVGSSLILRADGRFDEGFPLGGAVLLPEVERFFAGGDTTVRGYNDDRLATEVLQVAVPPLGNVQQIRILPAGGNIRTMASLDAQLRIYSVLGTAIFVDAGMIANQWSTIGANDIRPSVGIALFRIVLPFGVLAMERAIPLRPQLGDDPRGRWHITFAARAQF